MRSSILLVLLALAPSVHAEPVHGYCERIGWRGLINFNKSEPRGLENQMIGAQ